MPDMAEKVTREGQSVIDAWTEAKRRLAQAKSELNSAECNVSNATDDLARWLLPPDAAMGEKIAVWHGDSLIQAEVTSTHPMQAKITVRSRGKSLLCA